MTRIDCTHPRARHRHGTTQAYTKDKCRCDECREAATVYNRQRKRSIAYGRWDVWTNATGTIRRLQALTASGWSAADLAAESGDSKAALLNLRRDAARSGRVHVRTAARVAYLYERLWHVTPPGRYGERCERHAARMGWAAPWQWEGLDIDDPAAVPHPVKAVRELEPCGTVGAYRRHYRRGEPACRDCNRAHQDAKRRRAAA